MESISDETENELGEVEKESEVASEEVVETPEGEVEYIKGETPRETARRVADKLQSDSEKSTEDKSGTTKPDTKLVQKPQANEPDIAPPDRLKPEAKELFKNLPKGLKSEYLRNIKDLEATTTRANQELIQKSKEIEYLTSAVQPFASSWADKGFSLPQGILSLARAQEKLTNSETSLQSYVELGVDLGHIPEDQAAQILQQMTGNSNSLPHPQITTLQSEIESLKLQREQDRLDQLAKPIVEEMDAVRREVNPATGQLRYPELMNGDYLQSLRPRIENLQRNNPSLGYGEALRLANAEHKQEIFGFSSETTNTHRSPAASNINQRAAQAAVTVRGRTSPTSLGAQELTPPPEALKFSDPRATARWAYEQLKNR